MSHHFAEFRPHRRLALFATTVIFLVVAQIATPANAAITGATVTGQSPATYVIWTGCTDVLAMSDNTLAIWKSRGVDGFSCDMRYVKGLGGDQDLTADPNASLTGTNYTLQR